MKTSDKTKFTKRLLLVDGHAVAFRSWFQSDSQSVVPGFLNHLMSSIEDHNPTHLIVAFDPPPPTFRHKIYSDYKANRPPVPDEFLEECSNLFVTLDCIEVEHHQEEGYEADDVLGTLTKSASSLGFMTTIITSDLDLLQLLTDDVSVEVFSQYWPTRTFDVERAKSHFDGIEPRRIPDLKGLVGDRSDNLPGVKGIGEVAAKAILNGDDSLEDVYQDLGRIAELPIRGAKRISRLLSENKKEAYKMRMLATIVVDVELDIDIEKSLCEGVLQRIESSLERT